jgi:hypothetical protein
MDRSLVFGGLALSACGWLVWLGAALGRPAPSCASARELERRHARALWSPFAPALVALVLLLGWFLQEPPLSDEPLHPVAALFALPVVGVWLRAGWRALRAALASPGTAPACTHGLLRPRVVLDERFRTSLDSQAFEAVLAHEHRHAAHRDPLRILLAQLAGDLQWPVAAARLRFERWRAALELARDEEARERGASGPDLAAAILAACRRARAAEPDVVARLTGVEQDLIARIDRLLAPLPHGSGARPSWPRAAGALAVVAAALWGGLLYGDLLVRALPLVRS